MSSPKVALSSDFLNAFADMPKQKQSKVINFVSKFREDPTRPGINYEKINQAADPNFRSVRIDDAYRSIVLKPEKGNIYILLWVDKHDEAYDWAKRKVCSVHPDTGSLQIYDVEESKAVQGKQADEKIPGLFDNIHDRHIRKLGVPEDLLQAIRGIKNLNDLDSLSSSLPQEAYEALFFLAEGFSLDEVLGEIAGAKADHKVDTTDIEKALEDPVSKQRFHIVTDDIELQSMLQAPLEKWRVFLHPTQRKLVERNWNGPVRVLGGAGTGKTVVAMHRAAWLVRNLYSQSNDRILFTTFTRNLAADIHENLRSICKEEELSHVEVVNLDRWVYNFLKRNGYEYKIVYPGDDILKEFWEQAVTVAPDEPALPFSFYPEEWEKIIQTREITNLKEYLKASRIGRGVPLNRKARQAIWPVFEEYRLLLNQKGLREVDDAMRDARHVLQTDNKTLLYRAIVVDEAQDMGAQAFRLLRHMVPEGKNDLFIVGDAHQRIYRHKVVLGRCGINIKGRGRKLRINYRTTEENRNWAVSLLKDVPIDDLDDGQDDQKGYKSLMRGNKPVIRHYNSFQEEVDAIAEFIRGNEKNLCSICLVTRTNQLLKSYGEALSQKDISLYFIKRSAPEDRRIEGLRLATMHRVKGLEFETIIIAGVNDGIIPHDKALSYTSDPTVKSDAEIQERSLLYVSATRAKKELLITSFGKPSRFLK
jgi:superfamily I DNA/RNA helicase/mRNA-degrading endonuclease RelE of RelBE toxin-antitoxin system